MIEAHTFDAWTLPASRLSQPFAYSAILGGFAAPLFLWLAGVGATLSAASLARRTGDRGSAVRAVCTRGLEIFVLAFLFRLQSFVVTPGSYPVTLFRVDILNVMGLAIATAALFWTLSARPMVLVSIYAGVACAVSMVTPLVRTWSFVDAVPICVQCYAGPAGDYTTFTLFPWSGFVFAGAACGILLSQSREAGAQRRLHLGLGLAGAGLVGLGVFTAG